MDVFEEAPPPTNHPLYSLENAVATPHTAGFTEACQRKMGMGTAEEVLDVLAGCRPANMLNPEIWDSPIGRLADRAALHDALLNGRIGGAGLDVFAKEPPEPTRPVYQLPNVVVTPHVSGGTDGTARNRAAAAAANLDRIAQGLEPLYRVDR